MKQEKDYTELLQQVGTRQESLEEVAERFLDMCNGIVVSKSSFIAGAKYQAERSYSEEDMHKAYCAGSDFDMSCLKDEQYYMFKNWFKKFKKKA